MKTNLTTFPRRKKEAVVDAKSGTTIESIIVPSIGDYEVWGVALEKELREMLEKQRNNPEAFYAELERKYPDIKYVSELFLMLILGDVP